MLLREPKKECFPILLNFEIDKNKNVPSRYLVNTRVIYLITIIYDLFNNKNEKSGGLMLQLYFK